MKGAGIKILTSTVVAACMTVLAVPVSIISSGAFCGRIPDVLNFSYIAIAVMFLWVDAFVRNAGTNENDKNRMEKEINFMVVYVCSARIFSEVITDNWFFCPNCWLGCVNMSAIAFYAWILFANRKPSIA